MNREEYTSTSFQDDHKQIILCYCKYPAAQVQNSRRSKAKLIFVTKRIFSYTVNFVRLCLDPLL